MTQPKMIRCEGSGQVVYGPDEPTGTVQCFKRGNSALPMRTAVVDGKEQYSLPEHKRRANPFRRKGVKKAPVGRKPSSRNPGRRQPALRTKRGTTMPDRYEEFMALVKAGKNKEVLAFIEAEKVKAKYSPDTIVSEDGKPPRFTKRGKQVECGEDGIWRPKLQAGKLIHTLKLLSEDADISEVFRLPAGTLTITASTT